MKDIKNYEGLYAITEDGKVWSYKRQKFLSPKINKLNRMSVMLCKGNDSHKMYSIHRLVAQAYIPNPDSLPEVNHKDENPMNNSVSNLEWCTGTYNVNYGTRNDRCGQPSRKPVYCVELDKTFISLREAAKAINVRPAAISHCLIGNSKICGGYHWRYV